VRSMVQRSGSPKGQLVSGKSVAVGFIPIKRPIAPGAEPVGSVHGREWVEPVIDFLATQLPRDRSGNWEHQYTSCYEAGCNALIGLGYAAFATSGAVPVPEPALPTVLPRWDDLAAIVVSLAAQNNILGYRHHPGARDAPKPSGLIRPNIRAANGCGPAFLAPEAFPAFQSLGLILDGRWTREAETILWRDDPQEWAIDFTVDKRFLEARDIALATIPEDIAAEIESITAITEQDIVEWLAMMARGSSSPQARAKAVKNLQLWTAFELDDLFHERWRYGDGWLSEEQARRGLTKKYDPVALNMRVAFAARYLPDLPILFQRDSRSKEC